MPGRAERLGKALDEAASALPRLRSAIGRVANRALLARLTGPPGRRLVADMFRFGLCTSPVLAGRLKDLAWAMLRLNWLRAARSPAHLLRTALDALGGVFVKISQVASHGSGVLPAGLVAECQGSLDQCAAPVVPWCKLRPHLQRSLNLSSLDTLFSSVDPTPIASASIAQVHRARLACGEPCVVKVVRPGVRDRLAADLELAMLLARLVDLFLGDLVTDFVSMSLEQTVGQLQAAMMAECDLAAEREHMAEFGRWLADSPTLRRAGLRGAVRVPVSYPEGCSEQVLTMQCMPGVPVWSLRPEDRELWAEPLCKALATATLSVLDAPVFHADLHQGNLLFCPASRTVSFIDFGVVGQLSTGLRQALLLQATAFATKVPDAAQFTLGFQTALPDQTLDTEALAQALQPLFGQLDELNPFEAGSLTAVDPKLYALLVRGQLVLHQHGVRLPHQFSLLIKTALFGAQYIALLAPREREFLAQQLLVGSGAFVISNLSCVGPLFTPAVLGSLARRVLVHGTKAMQQEAVLLLAVLVVAVVACLIASVELQQSEQVVLPVGAATARTTVHMM